MQKSLLLAAISMLAVLSGCTNPQQQAYEASSAASVQFNACSDAIINKPEYAALLPHTFMGAPPASELANETLPTPEEARLIMRRWDERAPCRNQAMAADAKPPINRPDFAQISAAANAAQAENVASFGRGQMTWAAYARASWKVTQDVQRQAAAANELLQRQQAQQAEINRENAIAAAAIFGATMPRPPQTVYVVPCTGIALITNAC
jgi:hypothetical protein